MVVSWPSRPSRAWSGLSAMTRSTAASISTPSVICSSPFSSTMSAASFPVAIISSNTSLAMRPEMVPSSTRSRSSPRDSGATGPSAIGRPAFFKAPKRFPVIQLTACWGSRPLATPSKYSAVSISATRTPGQQAETRKPAQAGRSPDTTTRCLRSPSPRPRSVTTNVSES